MIKFAHEEIFNKIKKGVADKGFLINHRTIRADIAEDFSMFDFKVHGIKGWKFGIWFYAAEQPNLQDRVVFFGMAEDNIDKFKPSYANPMFKFEWAANEESLFWTNVSIARILSMVKHHPIISYNIDMDISGLDYKGLHIVQYIKHKLSLYL